MERRLRRNDILVASDTSASGGMFAYHRYSKGAHERPHLSGKSTSRNVLPDNGSKMQYSCSTNIAKSNPVYNTAKGATHVLKRLRYHSRRACLYFGRTSSLVR